MELVMSTLYFPKKTTVLLQMSQVNTFAFVHQENQGES